MSLWSHSDEIAHHFRRYEEKELLEKVDKSGLKIINHSFFNTLFYPVTKIIRIFKNKFHDNKTDLDTSSVTPFLNAILAKIFASEKFYLRKNRFNVGVSLIMACEK